MKTLDTEIKVEAGKPCVNSLGRVATPEDLLRKQVGRYVADWVKAEDSYGRSVAYTDALAFIDKASNGDDKIKVKLLNHYNKRIVDSVLKPVFPEYRHPKN